MAQLILYWYNDRDACETILHRTLQVKTTRRLLSMTCKIFWEWYGKETMSLTDIICERNEVWYPSALRWIKEDQSSYLVLLFTRLQTANREDGILLSRHFMQHLQIDWPKRGKLTNLIELILDAVPEDCVIGYSIYYNNLKAFRYLCHRVNQASLHKALYISVKYNRMDYVKYLSKYNIKPNNRVIWMAVKKQILNEFLNAISRPMFDMILMQLVRRCLI